MRGIDEASRKTIAGVFENRLAINMPLQSDIATKYALDTNKTNLSNSDVQSDNPYNLYKFSGYGPGPFNNPSSQSVDAVLNPSDRDKGYLYFVANLKTGKVYYSRTMTSTWASQVIWKQPTNQLEAKLMRRIHQIHHQSNHIQ